MLAKANTFDIDKKDARGWTALHYAACEGNVESVKALLKEGASPFKYTDEGWAPLEYAAANDHIEVAKVLIAHDKKTLSWPSSDGRTPLHRACNWGRKAMVEYLLKEGANIEETDEKGKTPLHAAVSRGGIDNSAVIKTLIAKGANLEAKTDYSWTPLHSAVRYSDPQTVVLLNSLGADIEAKNDYGHTPLILLAWDSKMDSHQKILMAKTLLSCGAKVDAIDNMGQTALHLACCSNEELLVSLLLDQGADIDKTREDGMSAFHLAAKYNQASILALLKARKEKLTSIVTKALDKPIAGAGIAVADKLSATSVQERIAALSQTKANTAISACEKAETVPSMAERSESLVEESSLFAHHDLADKDCYAIILAQDKRIHKLERCVDNLFSIASESLAKQCKMQETIATLLRSQEEMRGQLAAVKPTATSFFAAKTGTPPSSLNTGDSPKN